MDFGIPDELTDFLERLDRFIEAEIDPLQGQDDNVRFFDYRREHSRTNWDDRGLPRPDWEALLHEARRRADAAGFYRFAVPEKYGGMNGSNLWMAIIREHLAAKGLGLHNDLQTEHSVVGNHPIVVMLEAFGTAEQKADLIPSLLDDDIFITFGLTEAAHGSDATFMDTAAVPETRNGVSGWRINGEKAWQTGMHIASHNALFARTSGKPGDQLGISCFLVPTQTPGLIVQDYMWTFNMPTDHANVKVDNVWVPDSARCGEEGRGLSLALAFVHENRLRQAASSLGAALYCIRESVTYAKDRRPFNQPLADNQAIQFPLVELYTQTEMLRQLIHKTAWEMDRMTPIEIAKSISDKVSMCNYWANRLCCEAADRAMQIHGGLGYSRHKDFEHIYRHHRRYRITEGSEEIQQRKVAAFLFDYAGPKRNREPH